MQLKSKYLLGFFHKLNPERYMKVMREKEQRHFV